MIIGLERAVTDLARARDGDRCRYCGLPGTWERAAAGRQLQFDAVDPDRPTDVGNSGNVVVACAGCRRRKGMRTPAAAGMQLLPPPGAGLRGPDSPAAQMMILLDLAASVAADARRIADHLTGPAAPAPWPPVEVPAAGRRRVESLVFLVALAMLGVAVLLLVQATR